MGLFDFMKPTNEFERIYKERDKALAEAKKDALFQFEDATLKQGFFDRQLPFLPLLFKDKNIVWFLYSKQCELMKQPVKYQKEDFKITAHINKVGNIIFKIIPPAPTKPLFSYRIYLGLDSNGEPQTYYLLKKEVCNNPDSLFGYDKDGGFASYTNHDINTECGLIESDLDLENASSLEELIKQTKNGGNGQKNKEMIKVVESFPEHKPICKNCGTELEEDEKFCHQCGAKV